MPGARILRFLLAGWLLLSTPVFAQRMTPLVKRVDWERLDQFQETITREEFQRLLDTV